jgi:hypothetical protein
MKDERGRMRGVRDEGMRSLSPDADARHPLIPSSLISVESFNGEPSY